MINKLFVVIILVLSVSQIFAQTSVSGKILSAEGSSPVPLVHVYNQELSYGTVSNDDGEFSLVVDSLPIVLTFSHSGYNTHQQVITNLDVEIAIFLDPKAIFLDPVLVFSGDLDDLIKATIKSGLKRLNEKIAANLFYRQITKTDESACEVVEAFFSGVVSADGLKKLNLENGRFGKVRSDTAMAYPSLVNFYYMSSIPVIQKDVDFVIFPMNKDFQKYYKYQIKRVIASDDDHMIVVVSFDPINHDVPIFEGEVYIDVDYKSVVRLKGSIHHDLGLSFEDRSVTTDKEIFDFDVLFNEAAGQDNPVFYSIRVSLNCDYQYGGRSMPMSVTSTMLAYKYNDADVKLRKMKKVSVMENLIEDIQQSSGNKEFWENNSILKRTNQDQQIISEFESKGYFEGQ